MGWLICLCYAARAGYSQNEMMDLIQKRRLDPGITVNVISVKQI